MTLSGWDYKVYEYIGEISGVDDDNPMPEQFTLSQNYPNPFNPSTKIRYTIVSPILHKGEASVGTSFMKFVKLKVYNVLGKEVVTLVNEYKPTGNYEVEFSGENLPSGVYYYQLNAGDYKETKKMILLR